MVMGKFLYCSVLHRGRCVCTGLYVFTTYLVVFESLKIWRRSKALYYLLKLCLVSQFWVSQGTWGSPFELRKHCYKKVIIWANSNCLFLFSPEHSHTRTSYHFTPTLTGKHIPDEPTHTTEEDTNHIPEYEDRRENEIEARTPTYETESEQDRIPGRVHPEYNGYDVTPKWYHPKTTDNRVVPPESEFFATIVGKYERHTNHLC